MSFYSHWVYGSLIALNLIVAIGFLNRNGWHFTLMIQIILIGLFVAMVLK